MASLFNDTQYVKNIAREMMAPKKVQYQEEFIRMNTLI